MKKLKIKIKGWLLVKLAKSRKEVRILKDRIIQDTLDMQNVYDEIKCKDNLIRDLLLKLDNEEREKWLRENNYERYYLGKKQIKKG